jgi:tight adherence protein B
VQRVLVTSLIALAALSATIQPVAAALAVALGPSLVLARRRRGRTARLEQQLDGFLIALAHSLRATPVLGDALRSSAEVVAPPLSEELRVLLREHDLGTPLDRALENMAERTESPVVSAALGTLRIARSSGGDFVHTLERSAATLREMARLEGVVRTKTAEGRAQTVVVSALPLPTLLTIDHLSPELLAPLWTTSTGHILVAIAFLMWVVSILAARRVVHVDI